MRTDRFGALEHRAFQTQPVKGRVLEGYAAPFNSEAKIGHFTEMIERGAFKRSLAEGGDILALFDHDDTKRLGRTRSGSLKLAEDDKGLRFELQLPDTQHGNDVLALAQRGDLGGMSFGFSVRDNGESWDGNKRTLHSVKLVEVSCVSSFPAYEKTALDLALRQATFEKQHQTGRDCSIPDYRSRVLIMAELRGWI